MAFFGGGRCLCSFCNVCKAFPMTNSALQLSRIHADEITDSTGSACVGLIVDCAIMP